MPQLVIFAGPNGAGKTTFAREYLKEDMRFAFVNADEIARRFALETGFQDHADIRAGRLMLDQIGKYVAANVDFAVETFHGGGLFAVDRRGCQSRIMRSSRVAAGCGCLRSPDHATFGGKLVSSD